MLSLFTLSGLVSFLRHLGGPGLVALGVVSAVVPLPGSVDAIVVILSARHPDAWLYYAVMAMIGAEAGSILLYRVGMRGERGILLIKISEKKLEIWREQFRKHGPMTLVISAIAPPPFPSAPILLAAGTAGYPLRPFMVWTTATRFVRYGVIALAAALLGRRAYDRMTQHTWLTATIISVLVLAGAIWAWRAMRTPE